MNGQAMRDGGRSRSGYVMPHVRKRSFEFERFVKQKLMDIKKPIFRSGYLSIRTYLLR